MAAASPEVVPSVKVHEHLMEEMGERGGTSEVIARMSKLEQDASRLLALAEDMAKRLDVVEAEGHKQDDLSQRGVVLADLAKLLENRVDKLEKGLQAVTTNERVSVSAGKATEETAGIAATQQPGADAAPWTAPAFFQVQVRPPPPECFPTCCAALRCQFSRRFVSLSKDTLLVCYRSCSVAPTTTTEVAVTGGNVQYIVKLLNAQVRCQNRLVQVDDGVAPLELRFETSQQAKDFCDAAATAIAGQSARRSSAKGDLAAKVVRVTSPNSTSVPEAAIVDRRTGEESSNSEQGVVFVPRTLFKEVVGGTPPRNERSVFSPPIKSAFAFPVAKKDDRELRLLLEQAEAMASNLTKTLSPLTAG
mmetsp:Transcript_67456/g.161842  ORF Transcript_67456/g.161842 Transcript_67456/m.161842 type:complete len:362 (-) Transcript_67456:209-1294(-)